ncbi:MAG: cation:proton antiporter [Lachnospiraceae bacterium]|nr:cation:proton antiporter [Lachnospiraceae bacterium]
MSYIFLLWLAIILFSTKVCGLCVRKIHLPEVVGYLLAGVLLGPSLLGCIVIDDATPTGEFLEFTAELGVVFLMFSAGLTTDMDQMKRNLKASMVTAIIGVLVPLVLGTLSFGLFFGIDPADSTAMLEAVFVGVILTATSVSITVQTLKEMGKLSGDVGTTILGAAVIDDILGIIVLTIVTSMRDTTARPVEVGGKIVLYAVLIGILYFVIHRMEPMIAKNDHKRRAGLFGLSFCMLMAFVSEYFFGIADITGAYFAGLILCSSKLRDYIDLKIENLLNMFFMAVFFSSIGIKVSIGHMSTQMWLFAVVLVVVAILSKMLGCGFGAKCCGFNGKDSLRIGVGMISRGEVALIVAEKGRQISLVSEEMFAPIVVVVIITTLLTPVLLKMVFEGD